MKIRKLNRRNFIQASSAALVTSSFGMPKFSYASSPTNKRFVFMLLRGAMDGLAAVAPVGDKDYLRHRPSLAKPLPGELDWIDIDGFFAFHPKLARLKDYYDSKDLAIIHSVASSYRGRSHFDGQDILEKGVEKTNDAKDGWLNRTLGVYQKDGFDANKLALAIGEQVPLTLRGSVNVASWQPVPDKLAQLDELITKIMPLYKEYPALSQALSEASRIKKMANDVLGSASPAYLNDYLETVKSNEQMMEPASKISMGKLPPRHRATLDPSNMKIVGKMLSREDGPRIVMLESGGWDTHARQGVMLGALANRFTTLAETLDVLVDSLQDVWEDTVILVVTEFGRQVQENGSEGTDHGSGGAAFALGGAVNGGKIYCKWLGLDESNLFERRDLTATTDLRSVQKAILSQHLGLKLTDIDNIIFPNSGQVKMMDGLIRS